MRYGQHGAALGAGGSRLQQALEIFIVPWLFMAFHAVFMVLQCVFVVFQLFLDVILMPNACRRRLGRMDEQLRRLQNHDWRPKHLKARPEILKTLGFA